MNNNGNEVPFDEIEKEAEMYANRRIGKDTILKLDWMEAKQGYIKGWMACYLKLLKGAANETDY